MSEMYQSAFKLIYLNYRYECHVPNGCPKHHTRCRTYMPILNASRWHVVSPEPPDTHTVIRILHAESGDLSEKMTLCQSCIHLCRPAHQSHLLPLCCIVNWSRNNGHQDDRSRHCKRHTIRAEIGHAANMPIFWLMIHNMLIIQR